MHDIILLENLYFRPSTLRGGAGVFEKMMFKRCFRRRRHRRILRSLLKFSLWPCHVDFILSYWFLNMMFLLLFPRYYPRWIFIPSLKGVKRQKRKKWIEMLSQQMFILDTTKTPLTLIQDELRVRLIFLNSSSQWVLKWNNFSLRSRVRLLLFLKQTSLHQWWIQESN